MRYTVRVLPPAGGNITNGDVLRSLSACLFSMSTKEDAKTNLLRQLNKCGLKHWIFLNTGRSALCVVLMALRTLYPGRDEVIIPAYTSYSVPAAVVRAGLRIRLCDVETDSLGMSPKELPRALTPRTLCIVPNHLYGMSCQIQDISQVARENGQPMVEDAAQSMCKPFGAATNRADAIILSFSRGKSMPAADGGVIGTNNEVLADACGAIVERTTTQVVGLKSAAMSFVMASFMRPALYGIPARMPFLKLGASIYNPEFPIAPMSKFQAILAGRLLERFTCLQALRQQNAARLRRALESGGVNQKMEYGVLCPNDSEKHLLRLPVLFKKATVRDSVLVELQRQGLGATGGYPSAIHKIPAVQPHLVNGEQDFPSATWVSLHLVTLPIHPLVTKDDIRRITEVFRVCGD